MMKNYLLIFIFILFMIPFTSLSYGELTDTTTFTVERAAGGDAYQLYNYEFSPDGRHAYLAYGPVPYQSGISIVLVQYELTTPYNVDSRGSEIASFTFPEINSPSTFRHLVVNPYSFEISDDGKFLYVFSFPTTAYLNGTELILKYELTTPFMIDTRNLVDVINYGSISNFTVHVDFSPDGLSMYVPNFYDGTLSEYRLSNPFEISFDNLVTVIDTRGQFYSIDMAHDGSTVTFERDHDNTLSVHTLSIPCSLSSIQSGIRVTPNSTSTDYRAFIMDIEWINSGFSFFIKNTRSSELVLYTFDTPYNIEAIPQSGTPTQVTTPTIIFNNPSLERSAFITESNNGGGCSGDCTYPTMGLDKHQRRLVDGGFSYNDNVVNVIPFHTPYPLITTETHKINNLTIKAWDNTTIRLIQFGLGIPEIGKPTSDAEILIEAWFEPYTSNIQEIKIIDPKDLLKYPLVALKSKMVDCREGNDEQCLELTLNYVYDNIPKYNIIKIDVMDFARNVQSTTFNDGIDIVGTVFEDNPRTIMVVNPPSSHPEKHQVEISKVSNTNDLWIDKYGYHWVGDESKIELVEDIQFVRHQDKQSNFGNYDRYNSNFEKILQYEKQRAEITLQELTDIK